jgi:hypothetical protein
MDDERVLLEQRIRWLEWKVVRLLWFSISVVSFMAAFFVSRNILISETRRQQPSHTFPRRPSKSSIFSRTRAWR